MFKKMQSNRAGDVVFKWKSKKINEYIHPTAEFA